MPTSSQQSAAPPSGLTPLHLTGNTTEQQMIRLQQVLGEAVVQACRASLDQLDCTCAQTVLEQHVALQAEVVQSVLEIIQRHTYSDKFRNEEVTSNRDYPPSYHVRSVEAQVSTLRRLFPSLGSCMEKIGRKPLLDGAEGWFVFPRWQALGATYNQAVEAIVSTLANQRKLSNRIVDRMTETYLRQTERGKLADRVLASQQQGNDFYVVAAQFGMLHRGCSARRARNVMAGHEFGLGVFQVAAMLLTHPERLSTGDTIMVDCAGDEYAIHGDQTFDRVPLFDYGIGGIEFSIFYEDRSRNLWGTPSGFLYKMN